jgi:amidohydrolase
VRYADVTTLSLRNRLKAMVINELDTMQEQLVTLSDDIHKNPEIGFQEVHASQLLTSELQQHGFEITQGIAGLQTAFKAELSGQSQGIQVALLAEMDALPGLGHACGHNLIATASVGAAIALSKVLPEMKGTIVVFGTPAEEAAVDNAGGKVQLLHELRKMDAALLVHPSSQTQVVLPNICREALKIEFYGKAAHAGSSPHLGVNALDAAVNTFNLVNALRQHVKSDVRIHAIITHGGESPNIVPSYAALKMYVRASRLQYLEEVVEKVKQCAQGAALGTGTRVEIEQYAARYLNMVSNPTLAKLFRNNWKTLGVEIATGSKRSYGSTDMGNVSQVIPALHPYIAITSSDIAGHSTAFRKAAGSTTGHQGLLVAAKGLAMTAVDLFTTPAYVQQMKSDFNAFLQGKFIDY